MHTPAAALDRLGRESIDLVLLDVKLPGRDGFAFCRELRAAHDLPIIILSAWGSTVDRILGLELGSDDYLIKPCDPRELVARIRCVLRRGRRRPGMAVPEEAQPGLVIDRQRQRVWLDGAELTTSLKGKGTKALPVQYK